MDHEPDVDDLLTQLRAAGAIVQALSNRGGVSVSVLAPNGVTYPALGPTMLDALSEVVDMMRPAEVSR